MKFSFEVPIKYLKEFDRVNDYHFILAHMLLKDKTYAKFFKRTKRFKILDNGAAELGKSIDTNTLVKLAIEYKVDVMVLPDVWMDGKKTFEESFKTLMEIKLKHPELFQKLKFMYVIQGKSYGELKKYWNTFKDKCSFLISSEKIIVGVPYLTCAKIMNLISPYERDDDVTNARIHLIQKLGLHDLPYNIHLLGAGFNHSQEISFMRHFNQVKTVDTSTPFVLAKQGVELKETGLFERIIGKAGTLNFYEEFNKDNLVKAIHNAKVLKSFSKLRR